MRTFIILIAVFTIFISSAFGATTPTSDSLVCGKPYVDTRCRSMLALADALAITNGTSLVCASTVTLSSSVTVTSPMEFKKGCLISCGSYTITHTGPVSPVDFQVYNCSAGQVVGLKKSNPEMWTNNTTPGTTDMTDAFNAAIASDTGGVTMELQRTEYKINSTLQINKSGVVIKGQLGDRTTRSGTQISYYGTGPLFQLATDNTHSWTDADYDGYQGFTVENVTMFHKSPDTPVIASADDGGDQYKAGSYGIKDWRSGDVTLRHVRFEHFEYGFWGVQSDLNHFYQIDSWYNHVGIYAGPRSDQFNIDGYLAYENDNAIIADGADIRVINSQLVGCGYQDTYYPVEIKQAYQAYGAVSSFLNSWCEHYQGTSSYINACFGIGVNTGYGGSTVKPHVIIDSPFQEGLSQGDTGGYIKYLVEVGKGTVEIRNPTGPMPLDHLVSFVGNYTSSDAFVRLTFDDVASAVTNSMSINNGTGTPSMVIGTAKSSPHIILHEYKRDAGGHARFNVEDSDTAWKKAATITHVPSAFNGISFTATIREGMYGSPTTAPVPMQNYFIWVNRSGSVDLDNETATISGTSADYIRVVKTQAGGVDTNTIYELQYRQTTAYKDMLVDFDVISAPDYVKLDWNNAVSDGSTSGTIYSPTMSYPLTSELFSMTTGSIPSAPPSNKFYLYSGDAGDGTGAPIFKTGNGTTVTLNQNVGSGSAPAFTSPTLTTPNISGGTGGLFLYSPPLSSATGTTGLVTLWTTTIPAHSIGENGIMTITVIASMPTSTYSRSLEINFGGVAIWSLTNTTVTGGSIMLDVANLGSESSQTFSLQGGWSRSYEIAAETLAALTSINTGVDQPLTIKAQVGNAADNFTLRKAYVRIWK